MIVHEKKAKNCFKPFPVDPPLRWAPHTIYLPIPIYTPPKPVCT